MSSFACLRIELPEAWAQKFEAIRGQLEKIVEVYLEARWSWPRRFSRLSTLDFLLADPRTPQLDAVELCKLADQLQHHLFGAGDQGEVSLLLFEGPSPAVIAFAAFTAEQVVAAIADPALLPGGGRLTRIRPGANPVVAGTGPGREPTEHHADAVRAVHPSHQYEVGVTGAYLLSGEVFVADLLAVAPKGEPHYYATVEGERVLPPDEAIFDEVCFRGVDKILAQRAGGLPLGVPVAYSHFVRHAQTERLAAMLALLPKARRAELNASVYGVPRHLPAGVGHLHPLLDPYFCTINLVTADPGFEIEQIAPHTVGSVVFCLRESEPAARQAAMRAFAARHDAYRHRGVRQVTANLRSKAELELAARLDLQLVSGPAICGYRETPVGGRAVPLAKLPLASGSLAHAARA